MVVKGVLSCYITSLRKWSIAAEMYTRKSLLAGHLDCWLSKLITMDQIHVHAKSTSVYFETEHTRMQSIIINVESSNRTFTYNTRRAYSAAIPINRRVSHALVTRGNKLEKMAQHGCFGRPSRAPEQVVTQSYHCVPFFSMCRPGLPKHANRIYTWIFTLSLIREYREAGVFWTATWCHWENVL